MLYSNEDFENFYVRYRAKALLKNTMVKAFFIKNNVPWNLFDKWETPDSGQEWTDDNPKPGSLAYLDRHHEEARRKEAVKIMVDIRMSNGMQIRQRNLSHRRLMELVEKMEELC